MKSHGAPVLFLALLMITPVEKNTGAPPAGQLVYSCHKLPEGDPRTLLSSRKKIPLRQSWFSQSEPLFAPGQVAAGWREDALYIYAELHDLDIFNPVKEWNQPAHLHGDIFEILLRPATSEAYYEFHITPHNQVLQLRFPSRQSIQDFRKSGGDLPSLIATFSVAKLLLEPQTSIAQGHWTVLVKIPAASLGSSPFLHAQDAFLFSFCRYDHTRGESQPVLSSSSPHPVCDFHRQEEWGTLVLKGR